MEMDRPLGFYHNPKVVALIYKEKKYSTMYMNENGNDVMILKCVNGKSVTLFLSFLCSFFH